MKIFYVRNERFENNVSFEKLIRVCMCVFVCACNRWYYTRKEEGALVVQANVDGKLPELSPPLRRGKVTARAVSVQCGASLALRVSHRSYIIQGEPRHEWS